MGDVDGMSMVPAPAADAMSRLATAGDDMTSGWRAVDTELTGLTGQLGRGVLGAAFMAGYREAATQTARAVEQCCQVPGRLAAKGTTSVDSYVSNDSDNRDTLTAP
jgi:hypothetical protein